MLSVTKAQATGNDFVMIFDPDDLLKLDEKLVQSLCDRKRGVGADGLIRLVRVRSEKSDDDSVLSEGPSFFMDYRNADGNLAEMCGNGIRCAALYLLRRGVVEGPDVTIETRAGRKTVKALEDLDRFVVDMGPPSFSVDAIADVFGQGIEILEEASSDRPALVRLQVLDVSGKPTEDPGLVEAALHAPSGYIDAYLVSMGNPHAVVVWDAEERLALELATRRLGSIIENHPAFKAGANVEFVQVEGPRSIRARVWERGVGETLACGTGACAVAVAAMSGGLVESESVEILFPGGALTVSWDGSVYLEGEATEVFEAQVDVENLMAIGRGGVNEVVQ